ncbi:ABC transporter permease [Paenibacillus donghaensis]|uniref:ABC transporter permease n=1 Tax=Paenibacillus donghaensis TaxID=414771 RepID=A0A2Z2KET9_9BACL|nr:ABC transporter permease [Paenibacillus donghaensis]ASA24614.1 ABC transporter permease [Paenibacillus donghaensis]
MSKSNTTVLSRIAKANLKAEKEKNYFVGIVIAAAAFLLTVVLIFGYNSSASLRNQSDFQSIFSEVNADQVRQLSQMGEISKLGLYKEAGQARNDGRSLSMLYTDQTMMALSNASISQGAFPAAANEIAIEQQYIADEAHSPKLGERITLEFRNAASKEIQTADFVISGFLRTTATGEDQRVGYSALVSKAFIEADRHLSQVNYSAALNINDAGSYSNAELRSLIEGLGQQIKLSEQQVQINNVNVDTNNLTGSTMLTLASIMLVIVWACWLVIYNIFYISISKRIRHYGQLRAIGATRKQIKKLVLCEGKTLSLRYIPPGVVLGGWVSWLMSPGSWNLVPDLFLALTAGLFAYLTVRISINTPAKFAARIAPVEAIRHNGTDSWSGKERKSSKRLTSFTLAALNLLRSKKKTILTLSSLIFSGILFITFATLLNSADPVAKAKLNFPNNGQYDIQINNELYSETVALSDLQAENQLSGSLKEKILSIDGVERVIDHRYVEAALEGTNPEEGNIIVGVENMVQNNQLLGEQPSDRVMPEAGSSDPSHILMNSLSSVLEGHGLHYAVGDHVSLSIGNDQHKLTQEFEIVGDIRDKNSGALFYLPSGVMESLVPFNSNLSYEVVVSPSEELLVKQELVKLISSEGTLKLVSFSELVETNRIAFHTIRVTIYSFMIFIALFAVINLMNTIITTISSRRAEIGIMQAIGMTRLQVGAMLGYETGFLIVGSFAVALVAGNGLGYWISRVIGNVGGLSYIRYQFPASVILTYVSVILLMQYGIIQFVRMSIARQTVVERLQSHLP